MRNHGLEQRRSLWGSNASNSGNSSYNLLSHMEQTANNNPTSASAQNSFYSALLRANRPELVVQRFDTGQFASNAAVEATYKKALDQVAQSEGQGGGLQSNPHVSSDHLGAVAQAIGARSRGGNSALAKSGSGAKDAPLYVVVEESYGSTIFRWVKFTAWFAFAVWIFYVIISLMVEGAGLLKRVGGINVNEAKPELQKTKFADVEGCDEAKEELQELVAFLKDPKQFSTLGGKLPKGVLLVGPPGTGKTLLARAVAGEAGVPFFYASGSEFDEMYVGVGAKRIRELFTSARAKSPAIIFIDELDAIGGKRNPRDGAYAKQTLNQLLTELDGFDQGSGIIIIAATNFPQSLDNALTRPGRFDRNVNVPLPDVRGRMAILKLKLKNMQIGTDVDLSVIARGTTGFSGADLENLANQAAVHASKRKATKIHMSDYEWAKDKILMGPERRSAVIQQKDKVMTAYHEGGHALVALLTPYATPLYKATIMPRGHALGITFQLSEMDRVSESKQEMLAQIDVCMGGKCAEILVYGEDAVTSGASSDISAATKMALAMVKQYGMSDKLGNLDLNRRELPAGMNQLIWDEVKRIIDESKERVLKLLKENRKSLDAVSQGLVDYEILDKVEMEKVIKGEKLPDRLKSAPGPIKPIEPPKITVVKPGGPPPGPADPGLGTPPPVDEPSGIPGVGVGDGTPPAGFPPVSPAASSSTKEEKTK
ncbi:cell division protease ftsH [Venturia nashicola]|uniref:Cell division protease ftsH n=1 Tax=Venturia nashicola TaxID=86259 RepID=A0A4Z1NMG1_9PEZI|nr:cell division protease ftsH [Venturia nashicola]